MFDIKNRASGPDDDDDDNEDGDDFRLKKQALCLNPESFPIFLSLR